MKTPALMLTAALACACGDDSSSPAASGDSTSGSTSSETPNPTADDTAGTNPAAGESLGGKTTGPMPCSHNEDCPDEEPFCNPDGECVECHQMEDSGAACTEQDPGKPLCWARECVACTASQPEVCKEQLLLCDAETNTCAGCTEHGECESGACDIFDGRCFDPNTGVLHVGSGQTSVTLGDALDAVELVGVERAVLVLHEGATFNEAVTVDSGAVAFVAAEGDSPLWVRTSMPAAPTLTVSGAQTRVYVAGVLMRGNGSLADPGLLVDGGQAWVDRGRIVANLGGGVLAQNSAELVLRNCFVGGDVSDRIAVQLMDSNAEVLYSTLGAGFGSSAALTCTGSSNVDIRNSVMVSRSAEDEVQCTLNSIEYSAAEFDLGGTNTPLGDMDTMWFAGFGSGDFHLDMMAPPMLTSTARWQTGDPTTDIDGDLRPTIDATPDYAGADVPL